MRLPKDLTKNVLARITPSAVARQETLRSVNCFLSKLNTRLRSLHIQAKAVLGGSYAKETWLAGDYDVDIFVRFSRKHWDTDMSVLLGKALAPWKPVQLHGSRDYFQIHSTEHYEIIPVRAITGTRDAVNTTDFSPLHVAWVNTHAAKFKNDIRLFKQFCKAHSVYGAESYIRGISGHVADLLIAHYNGFLPCIKAIARWQPKVVIDPSNIHKGRALLTLNTSKTEGPLVIIDPVQPGRNAAAAFLQEKFDILVKSAQDFLATPTEEHFKLQTTDWDDLAKKGFLYRITCTPINAKTDVAGTCLLKLFEHLRDQLQPFTVKKSGWQWTMSGPSEPTGMSSPAVFWFVLAKQALPDHTVIPGPPLKLKDHVINFRKTHAHTFTKAGKIHARITVLLPTATERISHILQSEYTKTRSTSCHLLKS